jgi:hypothetical protein
MMAFKLGQVRTEWLLRHQRISKLDNCRPIKKPPCWEDCKGASENHGCTDSECLCRGPKFDLKVKMVNDAAATKFRALRISTDSLRNLEWERMFNALAMCCASYGYPLRNYTITYTGLVPELVDDDNNNSELQ